jgi:2C-methyl-D-erythritol 2,4-cyclodiphosphate synthase
MSTPIVIHISTIAGGDPDVIAHAAADALLALGGTPELDAALALAHTLLTDNRQQHARRHMLEQAAAPLRAQLAELEAALERS